MAGVKDYYTFDSYARRALALTYSQRNVKFSDLLPKIALLRQYARDASAQGKQSDALKLNVRADSAQAAYASWVSGQTLPVGTSSAGSGSRAGGASYTTTGTTDETWLAAQSAEYSQKGSGGSASFHATNPLVKLFDSETSVLKTAAVVGGGVVVVGGVGYAIWRMFRKRR